VTTLPSFSDRPLSVDLNSRHNHSLAQNKEKNLQIKIYLSTLNTMRRANLLNYSASRRGRASPDLTIDSGLSRLMDDASEVSRLCEQGSARMYVLLWSALDGVPFARRRPKNSANSPARER